MDSCIQTGVDNPGHPFIMTVGLTAGDEECYDTFKELFDPVIDSKLHVQRLKFFCNLPSSSSSVHQILILENDFQLIESN